MDNEYYQTIFKRKSFHIFRGVDKYKISDDELKNIEIAYDSFERLYPNIKTKIRIVPANKVLLKRDAEYCILMYSEEKPNYLMNIGYIGEQLDLYLNKNNIGALWLGLGKTDLKEYDGLKFVIMFAIHKIDDESMYRKDMFRAKRKELSEIWKGDTLGIGEIVRFAPSACNSQPWFVENNGNELIVKRYRKPGKVGLLNLISSFTYNRIDIGIFLCFLEICLAQKEIKFKRELFINDRNDEYSLVAKYKL